MDSPCEKCAKRKYCWQDCGKKKEYEHRQEQWKEIEKLLEEIETSRSE